LNAAGGACGELASLPAAQLSSLIAARAVSPVELMRSCLARIERHDPVLRAMITVCAEQALAAAAQAESEIMRGQWRGPLHGLPFGTKDQLCTRGVRTTLGSRAFAGYTPDFDATVIDRLQSAGAILIGKENLHELGKGGAHAFAYGQPRNPWDITRTPSSSSSGSAISVAAGFTAGSLGEDTGGSIRGPAAANGVVGLRPTHGRVSRHGGVMHAWNSDTIGPLTRTVEDNAMFLEAISGHDPKDPLSARLPVPAFRALLGAGNLRGLRLGLVREMIEVKGIDGVVTRTFDAAIAVLRGLGAEVREVSLPSARHSIPLIMASTDVDVAAMLLPLLRSRWHELDVGTRTRLAAAALVPGVLYNRAMRARAVIRQEMLDCLGEVDAFVCPTALRPPQPIDDARETVDSRADVEDRVILRRICTHPFGTCNLPALAVPMGFTPGGLPLSLQLAGRPFDEAMLYRIGHAYQQATTWHQKHPDLETIAAQVQHAGIELHRPDQSPAPAAVNSNAPIGMQGKS